MEEKIEHEILTRRNINVVNLEMPNGEFRFKTKWDDNSGVNITTIEGKSEWQNAHFHRYTKELYAVQKEKIIIAIQNNDGSVNYNVLNKGDILLIEPMTNHNIYMCENAMIYTIKFGDAREQDWIPAEELDKISKESNVDEILK